MLVVVWVVVLDSQSVLAVADVLMPEEGSLGWHSGLDLESHTVLEWIPWEVWSSLVNVPGLIEAVVASVEDGVHTVSVLSSVDIKAGT